jgi:hypothetical protein
MNEIALRPSCWGAPKYDTVYRDNIIRTKWLPILEKMLKEKNDGNDSN